MRLLSNLPTRKLQKFMKSTGLVLALATASLLGPPFSFASEVQTKQFTCAAFYVPARSIWNRQVAVRFQNKQAISVHIDGLPVYAFTTAGPVILTAIDNERIQIDTQALLWTSDFRGMASSQGACLEAVAK